ncbi:hypothetical protein D3C71_2086640 [compost metagenome]
MYYLPVATVRPLPFVRLRHLNFQIPVRSHHLGPDRDMVVRQMSAGELCVSRLATGGKRLSFVPGAVSFLKARGHTRVVVTA